MPTPSKQSKIARPPVVAVMGHIDHGKSTLLDHIRKSRIVESEAGGITQGISAYEVEHVHEGTPKRITFLDTPGHEAFQEMRTHGGAVADVAILVVSAEDGVKPQTLEALRAIKNANTPYIVAINKIDKPQADIERTKANLLENEIYLEGMGGDVPAVPISAKQGTGVDDLLDMLLLIADLQELTTDPTKPASGVVIEAHRDPRKGVFATLVILDGSLKVGDYVVAGSAYAPIRSILDSHNHKLEAAQASSPVGINGFSDIPPSGTPFTTVADKKEAAALAAEGHATARTHIVIGDEKNARAIIPVIIKVDAFGSLDAIVHELKKHADERIALKIIVAEVGAISEGDVKSASAFDRALIAGFNVSVDPSSRDLAERHDIEIATFNIIYELAQWLEEAITKRIPKETTAQAVGRARVLRVFSVVKEKQVIGGRVLDGTIDMKHPVAIFRKGDRIGTGKVRTLQQSKADVLSVHIDQEFGTQIESPTLITVGDEIESYTLVED